VRHTKIEPGASPINKKTSKDPSGKPGSTSGGVPATNARTRTPKASSTQHEDEQVVEPIDWDTTTDMKALRAQARRYDEVSLALVEKEREIAMRQAGLDLESGPGRYFRRTYDGAHDIEAIKATAQLAGVPQKVWGPAPEPQPEHDPRYQVRSDRHEGQGL